MKCEEPIDELTKFGYCIDTQTLNLHFDCTRDRITDGQTDRWTDNPITRCLGGPFRPSHKNMHANIKCTVSESILQANLRVRFDID